MAPLLMPFSEREVFSITPVIAGAGRGTGSDFAWRCLLAASFAFQFLVPWSYSGVFAGLRRFLL